MSSSVPSSRPASRRGGPARSETAGGERLRLGLTLSERREVRRGALVDAALELFGTRGYSATTVKDVCQLAYVSQRDFYEVFDNREDLLRAAAGKVQRRVMRAFVDGQQGSTAPTPWETVVDGLDAVVRALVADPRLARIAYIETLAAGEALKCKRRDAIAELARGLTDLLADDYAKAGLDRRHADAFSLAIVGGMSEMIADWVIDDRDLEGDEVAGLIVSTARRMFPPPETR